jgi:hypothetical protein
MIEDKFVKGIVIESETQTPDGLGGVKKSWAPYITIEGRIWEASYRDAPIAHEDALYLSYYLLCNSNNPNGTKRIITDKHRVKYDGDIYSIKRVRKLMDSTDEIKYLKLDLYKVS